MLPGPHIPQINERFLNASTQWGQRFRPLFCVRNVQYYGYTQNEHSLPWEANRG
jgi:hypothetical protein